MKNHLVLLLFWFSSLAVFSQNDPVFQSGTVNLLTVQVDYETYVCDSFNMSYFTCPTCDPDSLSYWSDYDSPGDFGGMTFAFTEIPDTFFYGTIIWMGTGQIHKPQLNPTVGPAFDILSTAINLPPHPEYLHMDGQAITDPLLLQAANLAWETVSKLRIIHLLGQYDFDMLCYFYAPTVGAFDPGPAKWIFFFYSNDANLSNQETILDAYSISPNPASDHLIFKASPHAIQHVTLLDCNGSVIKGWDFHQSQINIDISSLAPGFYLLKIVNKEGEISVEKWIKE